MDRDGLLTGENDGDVPTLRTDTIHRFIATPLRQYQAYSATGNVLQVSPDWMVATSDPRLNHGANQAHSFHGSIHSIDQVGYLLYLYKMSSLIYPLTSVSEMRPSSLSHIHPYDRPRNAQTLEYNGIAQPNPVYQYNPDTPLLTNAISHPDSRQGSVSIQMKSAVPEYPSQDDTRSLTLTPPHRNPMAWSQSRPSSPLESSTRSFVAPTPTAANVTATSGYPCSTPTQPFRTRDRRSGMIASRPSPYPSPNVSTSAMLHPHPSQQRYIQRHRQYGSRKSTLKSGSSHDELLYAPPELARAEDQIRTSFLPAHVDGQDNSSSRRHATLRTNERSSRVLISIPHSEGASGQSQGSMLPPGEAPGHPSWAMVSSPSTCYGSATTPNTMRRMQSSSPSHIQPHHRYGNRESPFDSSSGYGERLYAPRPLYARGYGAPSSAHAHVDGHDSSPHSTLESSHPAEAVSFPILRNIGPTSGLGRGSTFQPFANPEGERGVVTSPPLPHPGRDMPVGEIPRPQFTWQGHVPAYVGRGQAPPATTHAEGNGNNAASSFASSNGQQNYSLQNRGPWGGSSAGASTSTIPTRTHTDPSYGQYHSRELLPFTSPVYQSDPAISASSTRSFPDDVWSPQFSPQGQPSDNLPPGHMPPVRHGTPRQHTSVFTSSYPDLDIISTSLGCTMGEGHSVPSSLALADEGRNNSAVTSTTYPSTTFNAQERLEKALGPSSALKNKALIKLLLLIFESPFFRTQEMEPTIDSEDGQALLGQIQQIAGCPPNAFHVSNDSIFTLFVTNHKFCCLICGKLKQSMVRVIGCVRSHLDHRPYPCLGDGGCETCPKDNIVKRFFTASLLHDHCNRKDRETACTSCGMTLMSSMKRHWEAMHPDTPFPYEDYPNYHKE